MKSFTPPRCFSCPGSLCAGRRTLTALIALLTLIVAAGCETEPKIDPFRTGLVYPLDARRLGFNKVWRIDMRVPRGSRLTHAQVLDDLLVTVEEPGNVITAIEADTGKVLWQRQVGKPGAEVFAPRRLDRRLLLNTETTLYVLDARTGTLLQSVALKTVVTTSMVVFGDTAIFAGADGHLFAHAIATGREVWAYRIESKIDLPPAIWDDNLMVVDIRGRYRLLSARDGSSRWGGRTFARSAVSPILSAWGPFVASQDTILYALNLADGSDRWQFHGTTPLNQAPVLLDQALYQPLGRRGLVALAPDDGRVLWRLDEPALPMAHSGDHVVLYTRPRLRLADRQTGVVAAEAMVGDLHTVLGLDDGSLILVAADGQIERLDRLRY
jgi:outer membrane protein assembly factor BamB